jgi:hypothetical protein
MNKERNCPGELALTAQIVILSEVVVREADDNAVEGSHLPKFYRDVSGSPPSKRCIVRIPI